uniref:Uncharacterized protein n=1 Tax=Heterorhabditis bacteriophora TaxID=37862 RepID=A0A1I7WTC5_HETBA
MINYYSIREDQNGTAGDWYRHHSTLCADDYHYATITRYRFALVTETLQVYSREFRYLLSERLTKSPNFIYFPHTNTSSYLDGNCCGAIHQTILAIVMAEFKDTS